MVLRGIPENDLRAVRDVHPDCKAFLLACTITKARWQVGRFAVVCSDLDVPELRWYPAVDNALSRRGQPRRLGCSGGRPAAFRMARLAI